MVYSFRVAGHTICHRLLACQTPQKIICKDNPLSFAPDNVAISFKGVETVAIIKQFFRWLTHTRLRVSCFAFGPSSTAPRLCAARCIRIDELSFVIHNSSFPNQTMPTALNSQKTSYNIKIFASKSKACQSVCVCVRNLALFDLCRHQPRASANGATPPHPLKPQALSPTRKSFDLLLIFPVGFYRSPLRKRGAFCSH